MLHKAAHSILDHLGEDEIFNEFSKDGEYNLFSSDEDGDDDDKEEDDDDLYGENAFNDMVSFLKEESSLEWGDISPSGFLKKYFMQLLDLCKHIQFIPF